MKPSRACLLFLLPFVVAGCAIDRMDVAQQAKTDLVGKRKGFILSCAGEPSRTRTEGDRTYLTYLRIAKDDGQDFAASKQDNPALAQAMAKRRYCEATFVIRKDRVEHLRYAGNSGGLVTQGEQCGFIVNSCVRPEGSPWPF